MVSKKIRSILYNLTPPIIARPYQVRSRERKEDLLRIEFYSKFLSAGDLCFDIGANIGNRLRCFRKMGCRVVAVEPQNKCFRKLESAFSDDKDTVLLKKAMGEKSGFAEMAICSSDVLSSLAPEFIERVKQSGRFGDVNWDATERVEITTLDQTISTHGKPRFLKIDVEGYELEVLRGLTQPVKYISIEWAPELTDKTTQCIEHMAGLGSCEFNISWGESMKFSRSKWISRREIENVMNEFRDDNWLFADIYAHFPSAV